MDEVKVTEPGFKRVITLPLAVSIYVTSVLGAGVLIMPGLAAQTSKQASILAWILLSVLSYPFAYTFSRLASRRPESGGIYSFSKEAFGSYISNSTGWLFLAWYTFGAPANAIAAGYYLSYSIPINRPEIYLFAGILIGLSFLVNFAGIRFSARIQMGVIVAIILVIVVSVLTSLPRVAINNIVPLVPNGDYYSIGLAAALIIWAYFGYENVPNLAEEFRNPKKDLERSVVISVILVGLLYTSVAIVTVGTNAYRAGGGLTPFASLLSSFFGTYGTLVASIVAVVAVFSTMNAYTAGMSRVIYAVSKSNGLPSLFSKLHGKTSVPHRSVGLMSGLALTALIFYYFLNVNIITAFLMVSGAAGLVYVIGSASAIKLLKEKGPRKMLPWISLVSSIVILSFINYLLVMGAIVVLASVIYTRKFSLGKPITNGGS